MFLNTNQIQIVAGNQTRPVVIDNAHCDQIEKSLGNISADEAMKKLTAESPLIVAPIHNSDKYELIDGHHRFTVLERMGAQVIKCQERNFKTQREKLMAGFVANSTDKPRKVVGTGEIEQTLSALHKEGMDILDIDLQRQIADLANHKRANGVARIAKKVVARDYVKPIFVLSSVEIEETVAGLADYDTSAVPSTSKKWQQGLGYLIHRMFAEQKEYGVLFVHFSNAPDAMNWNADEVFDTLKNAGLNNRISIGYHPRQLPDYRYGGEA